MSEFNTLVGSGHERFYRYRMHNGCAAVAERLAGSCHHVCAVGSHCIGDPWDMAAKIVRAMNAMETPVLLLDESMRAAAGGSAKLGVRCPICLKANPCDRHSEAQQIKALDEPEYLESVAGRAEADPVAAIGPEVPPTWPFDQMEDNYGCGHDEFPGVSR